MNTNLIKYTDEFYEFVYEVKKNAYIKYVEQIWGPWNEEDQRKYFDNFINTYKVWHKQLLVPSYDWNEVLCCGRISEMQYTKL